MSFYQPNQGGMRPVGEPPMPMPGAPSAHEKLGESENGALVPDSNGAMAPGTRLSSLIQQYSRNPAQFQRYFWRYQMDLVENGFDSDGKAIDFFNLGTNPSGNSSALPLARIKKVMKNDDEVKMISAEAPILFSRACEIFIADLTCRAFMVAEENKRRTIQRSDIANAIARSDLFDFLIDIVPRSDMMRNRSSSVPIRNAMPAPAMPAPFPGAGVSPRVNMSESNASFMPLRPSQQDMRPRMDAMDPALGMGAPPAQLKGLPKAPMPNEWGSGMYSFPTAPMGDARMHPGAGLGMSAGPPPVGGGRPVMSRGGVDTASFMDANGPLSMPPQHRGSLLNMVPYPMNDQSSKGDGNANE